MTERTTFPEPAAPQRGHHLDQLHIFGSRTLQLEAQQPDLMVNTMMSSSCTNMALGTSHDSSVALFADEKYKHNVQMHYFPWASLNQVPGVIPSMCLAQKAQSGIECACGSSHFSRCCRWAQIEWIQACLAEKKSHMKKDHRMSWNAVWQSAAPAMWRMLTSTLSMSFGMVHQPACRSRQTGDYLLITCGSTK